MSLKQQTKGSLVEMCRDLGISEEGTKPILEEKLAQHFDNHPELGGHDFYKKFYLFRQKNSPKKSTQSTASDLQSSPYKILKPLKDSLKSSPDKVLKISKDFKNKSSPYKSAPEDVEVDDDDDDEDDSEEESEEEADEDIELLEEELVTDKDSESSEDSEYKPKFEFVTKVQDWFIEKYESLYDYAEDQKDEFVEATLQLNDDAKKKLSTTDAVNALAHALELSLLVYQQVPLIPIKDATFLSQDIISKYPFINKSWKIWDISALIQFKFILVLISWFSLAIAIPLLFSYYFNFISKKNKKSSGILFDPLVFNITKLILAYIFFGKSVSFQDIKDDAAVWANEHGLIESATIFQRIHAHLFHNSITLKLVLAEIPYINAGVGILVALYVASL